MTNICWIARLKRDMAAKRDAANILANRVRKLETAGIVVSEPMATDGRRVNYRLTEKGLDLAPALLELLTWGAAARDN